jgi:glycine/serine hydroxymethyltransferase
MHIVIFEQLVRDMADKIKTNKKVAKILSQSATVAAPNAVILAKGDPFFQSGIKLAAIQLARAGGGEKSQASVVGAASVFVYFGQ